MTAAEGAFPKSAPTKSPRALKILRLERPENLYRSKLVLIRPDQHIAWRGDAVGEAMAIIDRVPGA